MDSNADFSIFFAIHVSECMSEQQLDLSKLRIDRSEEPGRSRSTKPKISILLYIGGGIFLLVVAFFFTKALVGDEDVVSITSVSFVTPSQATALLTASGYVVAQTKASVASKATGRLVYLGFKEGDKVRKNQIIARIESSDVAAALQQAKADLAVAVADKYNAEQILKRTKDLFDRQLASQSDLDAAQAQYDRVIATIASRTANEQAAEVAVENTNIRAPFDGTILTKNADIGEVVAPFAAGASSRVAVVTIADMSSLEVEADVSESNIERISAGQPCEISLDAYPQKHYRGMVDKIIPTADRAKATILTKVRFLEEDSRVLPEMSAKVHFLSARDSQSINVVPTLAVDPAAIVRRDNATVAYVLNGTTVNEAAVVTGITMGNLIEIKSGLQAGDKVVLNPSPHLHSGSAVKVKE